MALIKELLSKYTYVQRVNTNSPIPPFPSLARIRLVGILVLRRKTKEELVFGSESGTGTKITVIVLVVQPECAVRSTCAQIREREVSPH